MVITNKQKFNKKYGFKADEGHSMAEISRLTGVSTSILSQVMSRGRGAHKSNPSSVRNAKTGKKTGGKSLAGKMSATQWGQARIYSFVMGGKTQSTADKDLWEKHKGKKKSIKTNKDGKDNKTKKYQRGG
tara:strand:+ start:3497 stop:3886 length:390 start_codon:yes stop_codon:yes gene_type:complete